MTTHALRFPPFPPVPPGVVITPFSQFRECGIQIEFGAGDGDIELDGRGIPTLELRTKHDTDESKSEARKRKKTRQRQREDEEQRARQRVANNTSAPKTPATLGKPLIKEWWQDWEEGENLRRSTVSLSSTPLDRISAVVHDFWKHRRWPPHSLGVFHSWDKFRYYIGILDNPDQHVPGLKSKHKSGEADEDEDVISDEEEFDEGPTVDNMHSAERSRPERSDADVLKPPVNRGPSAEEKLDAFLADPVVSTKVFLSSYMRVRGIMWAERNLVYVPRLLMFFFEYVLRSAAFDASRNPFKADDYPQSEIDQINRDMQRIQEGMVAALEVAKQALAELPLTAVLAQSTDPWTLSDAVKDHWGMRANGYKQVPYVPPVVNPVSSTDESASHPEVEDGVVEVERRVVEVTGIVQEEDDHGDRKKKGKYVGAEPTSKRVKLDESAEDDDIEARVNRIAPKTNPGDMNVDAVVSPPWMKPIQGDIKVVEEVIPIVDAVDDVPEGWGNWGGGNEGDWGSSTGTWGQDNNDQTGGVEDWDQTTSAADWLAVSVPKLADVLGGPTTLPETHAPGVVESSLRRIKAVLKPGEGVAERYLGGEVRFDSKDPEEMEAQLGRRFLRVVLEPWLYTDVRQDAGDSSRGRVERRIPAPHVRRIPGMGLPMSGGHRATKAHNMLGDDITILVNVEGPKGAETIELFKKAVGMGLGGYFIELARVNDFDVEDEDSDIEMEDWDERADEGGNDWRRYWYMEELTRVYPSYWLPLGLKAKGAEK
ncbi:VRR-NUC domain-containing protein [Pleurotus pulmonarius]